MFKLQLTLRIFTSAGYKWLYQTLVPVNSVTALSNCQLSQSAQYCIALAVSKYLELAHLRVAQIIFLWGRHSFTKPNHRKPGAYWHLDTARRHMRRQSYGKGEVDEETGGPGVTAEVERATNTV